MQNGWYDAVSGAVQSRGKTLASELRNMYVSPVLAESPPGGDPRFGL